MVPHGTTWDHRERQVPHASLLSWKETRAQMSPSRVPFKVSWPELSHRVVPRQVGPLCLTQRARYQILDQNRVLAARERWGGDGSWVDSPEGLPKTCT